MSYQYKLENFLSFPVNGNQRLIINDKNNNFVDSIITDLSHYFVRNNCLVIKITNKNDLILSFEDRNTAQQALLKLNNYRNILMGYKGDLIKSERPTFNTLNRNMMCLDMTPGVDYQLALSTPVLQIPKSRVEVIVRGSSHISCGYPDGIGIGCYFTSPDNVGEPSTARINDGDVQQGDLLYWIGSVAGFDLDSTDYIDYDYLI